MPTKDSRDGEADITLRDVIIHMQHMRVSLERRIDDMEKRLTVKINANTLAIEDLRESFTRRMDALEEDLIATMKDTLKIRRHVGMPLCQRRIDDLKRGKIFIDDRLSLPSR